MYQMIEGEYVVTQEYGQLAADPTDFFMRKYLPRVFGALEPLVKLPLLPTHPGDAHDGHRAPIPSAFLTCKRR